MLAVCSADPRHRRFETTAHVVEAWEVDEHGSFLATLATLETAHEPRSGNSWACLECGAEAAVYDDEAAGARAREAQLAALTALSSEEPAARTAEPGPLSRPSSLAEKSLGG